MLEKDVRNFIKKLWGDGPTLTWVEAGVGGTVGAPDLLLPIGRLLMPVEFKVINTTGVKFRPLMRPAQVNYHRMLICDMIVSAYVFGWRGKVWLASMEVVVGAIIDGRELSAVDCFLLGNIDPRYEPHLTQPGLCDLIRSSFALY